MARFGELLQAINGAGPRALIIKLPSCDAKTREIAKSGGTFYEREVRFYKEFPPHRDVPAPVLYHAEIDPGSGKLCFNCLGGPRRILTHGDQEIGIPSTVSGEARRTPLFGQDALNLHSSGVRTR